MKTIGLLGGMSWESSRLYYRIINEEVVRRLGGLHSARSVMLSFNFQEIEALQHVGAWDVATERLVDGARSVEMAGADLLLICTNTMHMMADEVQAHIDIPLLHIADATAERIRDRGLQRIGLLGSRFTMEMDFYKGRLRDLYGIDVLVPGQRDREIVDQTIYDELCKGIIKDSSRAEYKRIMEALVADGAEGLILGCTEITLLVSQDDASVPVFDTTRIHAEAAVDLALDHQALGGAASPRGATNAPGQHIRNLLMTRGRKR
jgi:aspartate racemase